MTTTTEASSLDGAALYRLLAWFSPAYPIGAYTYSHGIEFAVEEGQVHNRETLVAWIDWILRHGAGFLDAVLFAEAHRAAVEGADGRLDELAELGRALRASAETALESAQQGTSFVAITSAVWPEPAFQAFASRHADALPLAVAVGAASARQAPLDAVLTAFLYAFAANLVSAGVRLVPLGQTDGQKALAALQPVVAEVTGLALRTPIEEAGSAAPMVDWTSMRHETQYTRLFRS